MKRDNSSLAIRFFSIALSFGLVSISSLPQQVKANVTFTPPSQGQPYDTAGGASRSQGQCPGEQKSLDPSLTPLMPVTNHGLTVAEHPTLLVYIPQTTAKKVFFSLQDADKNHHLSDNFAPFLVSLVSLALKFPMTHQL